LAKDRWPLKRGSMHMKFSMTGQEKGWPFNIDDCLIEVTAWAGLTVAMLYHLLPGIKRTVSGGQ
jgi:hypothetical protein